MNNIFKNSFWLLSAQGIAKVISFFYTVIIARNLSVSDFGLVVVALSYFSLVSSVADFGVSRFVTREISTAKNRVPQVLSTAIFLRLSILSVFFAVFCIATYFLDQDFFRRNLTLLAVIAVIPQSISLTLDAAFVALLKINYSALGLLFLNIVTTVLGLEFIRQGYGAYGVILALIAGQLLYAIFLIGLAKFTKLNWLHAVNQELLIEIIKGSFPYALLGVLGLLYFRIDALMLNYLKGSFETGIYGAAYKFLEAIVFVPSVFSVSLFPVLARLHQEGIDKVETVYYKSLKIFIGVGLLIMFGYLLVLPVIISVLLPKYEAAIDVIRILSITIPFMFAHTPAVVVLLSTDKFLNKVVILSFITLGTNIVLNLLLIPEFSFLGAAAATVLSEILSFSVFYLLLRKEVFKR